VNKNLNNSPPIGSPRTSNRCERRGHSGNKNSISPDRIDPAKHAIFHLREPNQNESKAMLPEGPPNFEPSREAVRPAQKQTRLTCSTCGRPFLLERSSAPPFCSERCRLIDLGRWLEEDIGLPFDGDPGDTPVEYRGPDTKE
jgi:endogenous inhibitor of DNA gyrase (YacG/DUF329 family)